MKLSEARAIVEAATPLMLKAAPASTSQDIFQDVDGKVAWVSYGGIDLQGPQAYRWYHVFFVDDGTGKPLASTDRRAEGMVGSHFASTTMGQGGWIFRNRYGGQMRGDFLTSREGRLPLKKIKDITDPSERRDLERALEAEGFRNAGLMTRGRTRFSKGDAAWLSKANPRTWEDVENSVHAKFGSNKGSDLYSILAREYGDDNDPAPDWSREKWYGTNARGDVVTWVFPKYKGLA